jgi:hypothetical protein
MNGATASATIDKTAIATSATRRRFGNAGSVARSRAGEFTEDRVLDRPPSARAKGAPLR